MARIKSAEKEDGIQVWHWIPLSSLQIHPQRDFATQSSCLILSPDSRYILKGIFSKKASILSLRINRNIL